MRPNRAGNNGRCPRSPTPPLRGEGWVKSLKRALPHTRYSLTRRFFIPGKARIHRPSPRPTYWTTPWNFSAKGSAHPIVKNPVKSAACVDNKVKKQSRDHIARSIDIDPKTLRKHFSRKSSQTLDIIKGKRCGLSYSPVNMRPRTSKTSGVSIWLTLNRTKSVIVWETLNTFPGARTTLLTSAARA